MVSGLDGVAAAETILNHTDRANGMIRVRGHDPPSPVAEHGFEETVALQWEGFAGDGRARSDVTASLANASHAAHDASPNWQLRTAGHSLFKGMRIVIADDQPGLGLCRAAGRIRHQEIYRLLA